MSKILYPNGTEVAFKAYDVPRRFKVKSYTRGASKPYNLVAVKDSSITKKASADELCRFKNHRYNSKKVNSHRDEATPATCCASQKSVTRDDIQEIVAKETYAIAAAVELKLNELHDHLYNDALALAQAVVEDHEAAPVDETA